MHLPFGPIVGLLFLASAAYTDVRWRRIPNGLVGCAAGVGAILLVCPGSPLPIGATWMAASACAIAFGAAALRGWLGFGDVKMIATLALLVGGPATLRGLALGFAIAIAWEIGALARQHRPRSWFTRSAGSRLVPLAPFLFVGSVLAMVRT